MKPSRLDNFSPLSLIVVGCFFLTGFYSSYFLKYDFGNQGGSIYNQISPSPSSQVISSNPPELWEKIVSDSSASLVAIQVFRDNKLYIQGSGITMSSDGLVLTTADLAVKDGVYQVFYEDKIFRASIGAVDYKSNLMLLKSNTALGSSINFDLSKKYQSGQEIIIIAKTINLSKLITSSQKSSVAYAASNEILLDANAVNYVLGAVVVDSDRRFIGLSYVRKGKIYLINSTTIANFLKDYLEGIN